MITRRVVSTALLAAIYSILVQETVAVRVLPRQKSPLFSQPPPLRRRRRLLSLRDAWKRRSQTQRNTAAADNKKSKVHVDIPDTPDGHLVTDLPLLSGFRTKHWAGHLPASPDGDKYFFYWLFEPEFDDEFEGNEEDIPLLIWLNGGPGCSSNDGLFVENGPFRLKLNPNTKKYYLRQDSFSWHKLPAYTLYIDQPVGTGLSFTTSGKYPNGDETLNTDFYYFLQSFLNFHSDKFVNSEKTEMNRPLFMSGESYAGHYQAIYVNHILKQNDIIATSRERHPNQHARHAKEHARHDIIVNITGAAIGNGWVDPFYQYAGAEAAYGHGLIGMPEVFAYAKKEKTCQKFLNQGNYHSSICFDLIDDIVDEAFGKTSSYTVSSYDIRRVESKVGARDFPPGHKVVEAYLGGWPLKKDDEGIMPQGTTELVLKALHAEAAAAAGQRYLECTDPPYYALASLDGKGCVQDIIEILEHPANVQLLFFNGIMDMVCNHVGNERSLEKMPWKYQHEFNTASRYAWIAPDEPPNKVSGYMREFGNLKFLKVMEAGHMVPLDVPNVAFEMMSTFLYNGSFDTSEQSLARDVQETGTCPECPRPTCPKQSTSNAPVAKGIVISYPFVSVLLLVAIAGMVYTFSGNKRRSQASNGDFGLELHETGQYTDQPDEEFEENGIH